MRASRDGPAPFPRSAAGAALLLTSPPATKAPPAPGADTMAWEKAFRRSGRFIVITATPLSISARRSSVPVSIAVMSSFLAGEADPADHPWPRTDFGGQSGDGHLGDALATTSPGRHDRQPRARVRQVYRGGPVCRSGPAAGCGDPEHLRPAPCRGGRVADLDRQPDHATGSMVGYPPRPGRTRPPPRLLRVRPVQGHDGAGDVPRMKVSRGNVGQVGGPH